MLVISVRAVAPERWVCGGRGTPSCQGAACRCMCVPLWQPDIRLLPTHSPAALQSAPTGGETASREALAGNPRWRAFLGSLERNGYFQVLLPPSPMLTGCPCLEENPGGQGSSCGTMCYIIPAHRSSMFPP